MTEKEIKKLAESQYYGDGSVEPFVDGFNAGHAHAMDEVRGIWKKPEEKPANHSQIVEFLTSGTVYFDEIFLAEEWEAKSVEAWCYLSDFQNLLPSFATKKEGE